MNMRIVQNMSSGVPLHIERDPHVYVTSRPQYYKVSYVSCRVEYRTCIGVLSDQEYLIRVGFCGFRLFSCMTGRDWNAHALPLSSI